MIPASLHKDVAALVAAGPSLSPAATLARIDAIVAQLRACSPAPEEAPLADLVHGYHGADAETRLTLARLAALASHAAGERSLHSEAEALARAGLHLLEVSAPEDEARVWAIRLRLSLGRVFRRSGEVAQAETWDEAAVNLARDWSLPIWEARAMSNLALDCGRQRLAQRAFSLLAGALLIFEAHEHWEDVVRACINLGAVYSEQDNFDGAGRLYRRALEVIALNDAEVPPVLLGILYGNLAEVAVAEKQFAEAWEHAAISIEHVSPQGERPRLCIPPWRAMANVLRESPDHADFGTTAHLGLRAAADLQRLLNEHDTGEHVII